MKPFIRILTVSDFHSGHIVGLTHPDFDSRPQNQNKTIWGLYQVRRTMYEFFASKLEALKPIDVAIINGDCIDGKGGKSGGTELLTTDRNEQVSIAVAAIEEIKAPQKFMTFGTNYHGGTDEDWERQVAERAKVDKIGSHDWIDVRGLIIDYRHFISRATVPHTRASPLGKEMLWNILWAERGEYPRADIILRSHVHSYTFTGDATWLGITTPALQGYYTKYGTRICSGTVDFGFVVIDVYGKGKYTWDAHLLRLKKSRQAVVRVKEPLELT